MRPLDIIHACKEIKSCEQCCIRTKECKQFKHKYQRLPCMFYTFLDKNAYEILTSKEDI